MKLRCALLLALALALPSAAHAAPVTLGPGIEPGATVDSSGTAYIAWIGEEFPNSSLNFCRLPRGAKACDRTGPITTPGASLLRPFVTVDGATVRVFSYRYGLTGPRFDAVYMFTSTDGGASFDAGVEVGTNPFYDAVLGPGNGVSLVANNSSIYQRVPNDGTGPVLAEARLADDYPYTPSVAITPSGILAVFANGSSNARFRVHQGGGDPNDIATWSAAFDFSEYASYLRLASGPSGTFLQSVDSEGNIVVQEFTGSGFTAPVLLPGPAHELTGGAKDMTQDGGGRLHAVWPFNDANGTHIGYATSDDGTTWAAGSFEAGPDPEDLNQAPGEMRAAVAPDHVGVAVWQGSGSARQVYASAIGPVAIRPPAIGRTANAAVVKGKVRVKLKGGRRFVQLEAGQQVPLGSTFDTTKGTVALDTSAGAGKPLQHGEFNGGMFTVKQSRKNPLTTISMRGGTLDKCGRRRARGSAAKKRSRTLFSNVKGRFRTRGRNSTATVRGTRYRMTDTCRGTLTTVRQGTVVVFDFTLRKRRTLTKGQRYFAEAPPVAQRRGNR
jgi:hypothetical protein